MDGFSGTGISNRPTVKNKLATSYRVRTNSRTIVNRKKHLQQTYLLCGFAVHAFLASPVYLYGILYETANHPLTRIWPAIVFQGVQQFCKSFLQRPVDKINSTTFDPVQNRKVIVLATILTSLSIATTGYLFSPAWMSGKVTETCGIIAYGLLGGLGSSLIISRVHLILEIVRPRDDKYVRKTIHLCGEAFCQLFLSFVIASIDTLYGAADALALMGGLLLNLIPLTLLISKRQIRLRRMSIMASALSPEHRYSTLSALSKLPTNPSANQIDGIELQSLKSWKSPSSRDEHYNNDVVSIAPMPQIVEDTFVTYINPNGVEIMEIILEEDEVASDGRSIATVPSKSVICTSEYRLSTSLDGQTHADDGVVEIIKLPSSTPGRIGKFLRKSCRQAYNKTIEDVITPLSRALPVFVMYPATFMQAADILSYVLSLTVLPDLAITQHRLKFAEIPFLFSLLAFPWMCFALMTPRFGHSLVKSKVKWHIFGANSKAIGLLLIALSSSKLLLSLATVFLGFGQAVTLFLQDRCIKSAFSPSKWNEVKYPIHATNSILIFGLGYLGIWIIAEYGVEEAIGLMACIYFGSVVIWYLTIGIIYIFRL